MTLTSMQEFCKTDDYALTIRKYLINDIYNVLYYAEGQTMKVDDLFGALRERMEASTWHDPAINSSYEVMRLIQKHQWFEYLRSHEPGAEWASDMLDVQVTSGDWLFDKIDTWKRKAVKAMRNTVCDLLMNEFFDVANKHHLIQPRVCYDKQDIPPSARWTEYEHIFLYQV